MAKKTAREKLETEHASHGRAFVIPAKFEKRWGTGRMIVPRPLDVEAAMREPRKGRLITLTQIRERLARAAGVEQCCPLTTGIFARLAAEAAEEDRAAGKKRVTAYWRTIKEGGRLNEKFPGGAGAQAKLLRDEGMTIAPGRGKQPPRVAEFERYLVR